MVLRPVSPSRQRRLRVYGVLALVLVLILTFLTGHRLGDRSERMRGQERRELQEQVRALERDLRAARDELALHRTGSEVAYQAQEQVRQELRSLHEEQAELREAVAFYKSVMAPGSGDDGLRIERFRVNGSPEQGVYRYHLVLAQVVEDRNFVQGDVEFRLIGERDSEALELADVVREGSSTGFRFRYFEELDGQLELPEDFEPREVRIRAVASGSGERAEQTFEWQVQE